MAILGKGILDGFTGNMDGLTGQKRNGHNTISQRREGLDTNWSLQTDSERTKMSALGGAFRSLNINMKQAMFVDNPRKLSDMMLFVERNYRYAGPSSFVPHSDFSGNSKLGNPVYLVPSTFYLTGGAWVFNWRTLPLQPNCATNDRAVFMIYVPSTNTFIQQAQSRNRSQGGYSGTGPSLPVGTQIYFMLQFASRTQPWTSKWKIVPYLVQPF